MIPQKKHFNLFHSSIYGIKVLEDNFLHDITFDEIYISMSDLTKINLHVFDGTELKLRKFRAYLYHYSENVIVTDMIPIVNRFINPEIIEIDYSMLEIPNKAFGNLSKLRELRLFGDFTTIGDNAFSNLNNLEKLELNNKFSGGKLNHTSNNSLYFNEESHKEL